MCASDRQHGVRLFYTKSTTGAWLSLYAQYMRNTAKERGTEQHVHGDQDELRAPGDTQRILTCGQHVCFDHCS